MFSTSWTKGVLLGCGASGLALLLLWLCMPLIFPETKHDTDIRRVHFPGLAFTPVVSRQSHVEGSSRVISRMRVAHRKGEPMHEAVFRLQPELETEDYRYLRLEMLGWQPDQTVMLFWRSDQAPGRQFYQELTHSVEGVSWHRLPDYSIWKGQLQELAIGVFSQAAAVEPLVLKGLTLEPPGQMAFLQQQFHDWWEIRPWLQSSANRHDGATKNAALYPATVALLCCAVALAVLLLCHRLKLVKRRVTLMAGLIAILLPWFALDILWQHQLKGRLEKNRESYGGLTQPQKHQREADALLQSYAAHLKSLLRPLRHQRLFLLHDTDQVHDYTRLRMQFHLLPLNIFNFGNQLEALVHGRPGDHVLLLSPVAGVRYHSREGLLSDNRFSLAATPVDIQSLGQLFRLEAPASPIPGMDK